MVWPNKASTMSTTDEEGWLHKGDVVYFDEDGYLNLQDRLKDAIKYKGFQIAPADLESVLINHPEILDVAVAGVADEESGEIYTGGICGEEAMKSNFRGECDGFCGCTGCFIQEGKEDGFYRFNSKVCSWEDPKKGA